VVVAQDVVQRGAGQRPGHPVRLTLGFLLTLFAAVAAPIVVLFNWPKRLVAPHLRRRPGLISERLGDRPADTPAPRGSDGRLAGQAGPVLAVVVLLALAGMLVWACTVALVPALVAAVVSGAVAASLVRAGQAAGRVPAWWEGWQEAPLTLSTVSIVAQLVFAGGLIYVWEHSTSDSVAAAAMGVLVGACLAFASSGLRLILEYRRGLPPADAHSGET
jgi:hypothetical protein